MTDYNTMSLTREVPLKPSKSVLLIIDLQRYCCAPGVGCFKHIDPNNIPEENQYFFNRLEKTVLPSVQNLLKSFRSKKGKCDVIYTYIECLTADGRDASLDYKLSDLVVPKGSPDAEIISEVKPDHDEILIPKTSCSVFNSTNIEYVLRNLGVEQVVVTGAVTNQCVESAVRDAADRGFLVTLVEDAVLTYNESDHLQSLKNMKGFARICTHEKIIDEMTNW